MNTRKEFEKIIFSFAVEAAGRGGQAAVDKVEYGHSFHFTDKDAIRDLRENAAKLSESTMARLSGSVDDLMVQAIAEGKPISEITKDVRAIFKDAKGYEAERIARTETARATNNGALIGYKRMGVTVVEIYNNPGACPVCSTFNGDLMTIDRAMGFIPIHPNCYCFWIPRPEITTPNVDGWKGVGDLPEDILKGFGEALVYRRVSMQPHIQGKVRWKSDYHLKTPENIGMVMEASDRGFIDKHGVIHLVMETGEVRPPYVRVRYKKNKGWLVSSGYYIDRDVLASKLGKAVKSYGF